ncbi:MAG: chemotaxis protein CheW [Stagnimonas sp.]|nr:chemotaxis protein CheW [Stagnimonas sp.]
MSDDEPLQVPEQLYCVLLSLREDILLLPNSAVAEAIGQDALKSEGAGPNWLAGSLSWGDRRVPVVHFEALNGDSWPPLNKRSRLVVLHPTGGRAEDLPFAIVCQGYPHLITLSRVAIAPLPLRDSDRSEFVLSRVRIGSTEAIIPDIDRIAAVLLQARAQEAAL